MAETTISTVATEAAPASSNGKAKKPASKKAPAKKTPAKAAPAKATKEGLRKPQVRILAVLAKANGKPMTRTKIGELTNLDAAWVGAFIGGSGQRTRPFEQLDPAGYVKTTTTKVDDRDITTHSITDKGRKALATFNDAEKAKATAKKDAEKAKQQRAKEKAKKAAKA